MNTLIEKIDKFLDEEVVGKNQPKSWYELGQLVDLKRKDSGMKLSNDQKKKVAEILGIKVIDVQRAFEVFMWDMEPPTNPLPKIKL